MWIAMALVLLLVPVMMVGIGVLFQKKPPKKINSVYGYRTKRSMASQAAWDFAHRTCGRVWLQWGLVMAPVSVILLLPVWGRDVAAVGIWACVLITAQCVALFLSMIPVERALRRNFDRFGHRIKQ